MRQKNNSKSFISEIEANPLGKISPTSRVIYDHNDEFWCIVIPDMSDYKPTNNQRFR